MAADWQLGGGTPWGQLPDVEGVTDLSSLPPQVQERIRMLQEQGSGMGGMVGGILGLAPQLGAQVAGPSVALKRPASVDSMMPYGMNVNPSYQITRQALRGAPGGAGPAGRAALSDAQAAALFSGGPGGGGSPAMSGIALPFPSALPPQAPAGAHPANGYLDRLAIALGQIPIAPPNPYARGGAQFAQGLIGGAAGAWGAQRRAPIEAYQQYMTEEQKQRAEENAANIRATTEAAIEKNKVFPPQRANLIASPADVPQLGIKKGDAITPEQYALVAGRLLPPKPTYSELHKPPPPSDAAIGQAVVSSTITDSSGNKRPISFLDGTSFKSAEERSAARDWAVKNHQQFVDDPKAVALLREIGSTLQSVDDLAAPVRAKLATYWADPKRAVNRITADASADPDFQAYLTGWPTQIAALKELVAGGTGNIRITNAEINKWGTVFPSLTQPLPSFDRGLSAVKKQIEHKLDSYGVLGGIQVTRDANGNLVRAQ